MNVFIASNFSPLDADEAILAVLGDALAAKCGESMSPASIAQALAMVELVQDKLHMIAARIDAGD